jgi:hypothetical protein
MAQAIDSSPSVSPDENQNIERCIQDIDCSRNTTASHIGDCNLECSYCAARWSARRALDQREP